MLGEVADVSLKGDKPDGLVAWLSLSIIISPFVLLLLSSSLTLVALAMTGLWRDDVVTGAAGPSKTESSLEVTELLVGVMIWSPCTFLISPQGVQRERRSQCGGEEH